MCDTDIEKGHAIDQKFRNFSIYASNDVFFTEWTFAISRMRSFHARVSQDTQNIEREILKSDKTSVNSSFTTVQANKDWHEWLGWKTEARIVLHHPNEISIHSDTLCQTDNMNYV